MAVPLSRCHMRFVCGGGKLSLFVGCTKHRICFPFVLCVLDFLVLPFLCKGTNERECCESRQPFFSHLAVYLAPRRPHVLLSVPLRECGAVFLNLSSLSSTKFFLISFLSAFFRSLTPIQCIFTYSCRVARVFSNTSHSERRAKRGFFYPPPCDIMAVQMLLCACPSPSGFSPSAAFEDS